MKARRRGTTDNSRLVALPEYMEYISMGKNKAREFGEKIGALVMIGRSARFDLKKTDAYLNSITGQGGAGSQND